MDTLNMESLYLDRDIYVNYLVTNEYSSRHALRPYPGHRERSKLNFDSSQKQATWPTIQKRANWARVPVREIRMSSEFFKRFTMSTQIDGIAKDLVWILNNVKEEERKARIEGIANSFLIDTRSKLGRPAAWDGFPQKLESGSTAYMRLEDGEWVLFVADPSANRP